MITTFHFINKLSQNVWKFKCVKLVKYISLVKELYQFLIFNRNCRKSNIIRLQAD